MEFQEGMVRLMIHRPEEKQWNFQRKKETEKGTETGTPRRKWKLFHRSSTAIPSEAQKKQPPPEEFLCPISGSLMADPVIVSSGHSFERTCVEVCKALNFNPTLPDASTADFSFVIPNLALKSTITSWCQKSSVDPPKPLDYSSAEKLVRTFMASRGQKPNTQIKQEDDKVVISEKELIQRVKENPPVNFNHAATEVTRRPTHFYSRSEESILTTAITPPLQLATRPSCYSSSSSSSETETLSLNPISPEEKEIVTKLRSHVVFEVEEALITLRKITRTREETRAHLCTYQLLSALRSLINSKFTGIQVNSVAALVNLSLEKTNKIKILRSGIVPPLIDVLKGGSMEAQEHASGAIFSLALNDDNKTAIGVLGALPPLLHLLRSESDRTRHDSALALYHLSLVQTNRSKLVKLGAVPVLLNMAKSGHMTGRVLLVLCNLGTCADGRVAMLDAGAVGCVVEMLRRGESDSESTRESCVAMLYALSYGGLRFKALATASGAVEVLRNVEAVGSERAKQKARMIMEMMKGREEEEDVNWEELLESGFESTQSHSRPRFGGSGGISGSRPNSSEF
ncbi:Beta-catenin [Parasponia andersonii]|uniref:RING-type E3 ubiquitin transferase n=1 Tax=Parasponia andersonii TaxID=3476 RepID=A0A2P5BFA8_PARAD|nr:Beta-catenin [Parasponia andersonii]